MASPIPERYNPTNNTTSFTAFPAYLLKASLIFCSLLVCFKYTFLTDTVANSFPSITDLQEASIFQDMFCVQIPMASWISSLCGCEGVRERVRELHARNSGANCIFCRISHNEDDKARIVYEDEEFVAFHDISPSAQLHLLIVPRDHVETVNHLNASSHKLVRRMVEIGHSILEERGYTLPNRRLGFHVPPFTSVGHLHLHVLGLPFKNWVRASKYPEKSTWARWYLGAERLITSLQAAEARGESGTWNWSWTRR